MVYSHTILTAVFAVGAVSTVGAAPLPSDPGASARGSTGAVDIMPNSPLPPTRLVQGFTTTAEVDVPELDIIYEEESHEQPHHQPYQFVNHFGGERHDHQSEELEAGHPHFHHEEIEFKDRHPRFDDEEFGLDFEEHPHHPHPELRYEDGVEDFAIDVELDEHLSPDDHRFSDELEHVEYHALPLVHERSHEQPVEVIPVPVSVPVNHQIRSLERRSPQLSRLPSSVPSSPGTKVAILLPRAKSKEDIFKVNLDRLQKSEPVSWMKQIQDEKGHYSETHMYQRAKGIDREKAKDRATRMEPRLAPVVKKIMEDYYWNQVYDDADSLQIDSPKRVWTGPTPGAQVTSNGADSTPHVSSGNTADSKHVGAPNAPIRRSTLSGPQFGDDLD